MPCYLISGDVNDYYFRFIGFFVAQSLLVGFHFGLNILIKSDFQKLIFLLVKVEWHIYDCSDSIFFMD